MKKADIKKTSIILFWVLVWQALSMWVDNRLLFASPIASLSALFELAKTADFWLAAISSCIRIIIGFFLSFLAGTLIGAAAWRFPTLAELLSPILALIKAVPVASFVILALVWFGSSKLSVVVAFLIVFPQIYFATINGLRAADVKLLEMAKVFRFSPFAVFKEIYLPALLPYLTSACSSALGMGWKSGVAAEVIGTPANSIGEALYLSKVYMLTSELFAWTFVVIVLSALFEKLILSLLRKVGEVRGI